MGNTVGKLRDGSVGVGKGMLGNNGDVESMGAIDTDELVRHCNVYLTVS